MSDRHNRQIEAASVRCDDLEALEQQVQKAGDEINQCLQIILTNAGNISTARERFPNEVEEDKQSINAIYKAVQRAAKVIPALLGGSHDKARRSA